jgi:sulfite reductase alpha subunit-like flavoprotein
MHSPAASTCSLASTSAVDRVVILYASETGNAQDTAERVGREFRRRGRAVTLLSMDMFDIVSWPSLGCSLVARSDPYRRNSRMCPSSSSLRRLTAEVTHRQR